jgi:hypothetical protein
MSITGVNVEAMFCLSNMMNIKSIAMLPLMVEMQHETLANSFLSLYLMFNNQLELEETVVNFFWSTSQYPEAYVYLMRDNISLITSLMDQHTKPPTAEQANALNLPHSCEKCRERIFGSLLNMIEAGPHETCSLVDDN